MKVVLCEQCGINPCPDRCKKCTDCTTANRLASSRHFSKLASLKRSAVRAEKNKDVVCGCGCGVHIIPPAKYAAECREKVNREQRAEDVRRKKILRAAKALNKKLPAEVVQRTIIAVDEQTAIDKAVQASYLKRSGMDTLKQVKVYTAEEAAAMLARGEVKPLHLIPHRRFAGENLWSDYAGRGICG